MKITIYGWSKQPVPLLEQATLRDHLNNQLRRKRVGQRPGRNPIRQPLVRW